MSIIIGGLIVAWGAYGLGKYNAICRMAAELTTVMAEVDATYVEIIAKERNAVERWFMENWRPK